MGEVDVMFRTESPIALLDETRRFRSDARRARWISIIKVTTPGNLSKLAQPSPIAEGPSSSHGHRRIVQDVQLQRLLVGPASEDSYRRLQSGSGVRLFILCRSPATI
jgi:hypothetical protein